MSVGIDLASGTDQSVAVQSYYGKWRFTREELKGDCNPEFGLLLSIAHWRMALKNARTKPLRRRALKALREEKAQLLLSDFSSLSLTCMNLLTCGLETS